MSLCITSIPKEIPAPLAVKDAGKLFTNEQVVKLNPSTYFIRTIFLAFDSSEVFTR